MNQQRKNKSIRHNSSGITLIALVVTIIVLIILAGVSLNLILGENGIITKAREAAEKQEKTSIIEDIRMKILNKNIEEKRDITQEELVEILETKGTVEGEGTILSKVLVTNPELTGVRKSYEIPVLEIYTGNLHTEPIEVVEIDLTFEVGENGKVTVKYSGYEGEAVVSKYNYYIKTETDTSFTVVEEESTEVNKEITLEKEGTNTLKLELLDEEGNVVAVGKKAIEAYTVTFYDDDGTLLGKVIVGENGNASRAISFANWVTTQGDATTSADLTGITENKEVWAYYYPTCFVEGTKVLTEDGLINIEEIEVGIKVYSFNEETQEVELKEVTKKYVNNVTDNMAKVYVNGKLIESTVKHPYYVEGKGWIEASELKQGDVVLTIKGEKLIIENVEIIENIGLETVYNFKVQDNHNYYVGEDCILVHNKDVMQPY